MEQLHHHTPAPLGVRRLVAAGTMDAELGALLWILVEGGLPVLVCGPEAETDLGSIAAAVTEAAPKRDLADHPGRKPGTTLRAGSLKEAFALLGAEPFNLSDDEQRALGLVLVVRGDRAVAAHYVRPVERDKEGHLQHRPPAVLATWNEERGTFEHFAWAMTPELAARVGMSQADFEGLQRDRTHTLDHVISAHVH